MCLCTHTSRQRLGSYPLVLHAGYGHRVRQWNTWACGGDSSGRNQRRVTNLAIRMSEHSITKFHVCSKQVQKDSSPEDEEEEQASPLREDHRTLLLAPRCGPRWR